MSRTLPAPRPGLLGYWDRFVGPGMTVGENVIVLAASAASALAAALYLNALHFSAPLIVIGALIAFDVLGGAVCNMTDTTKRWFHRPDRTTWDHFAFIALHVVHIAIVAWLFGNDGFDLLFFLATSAALIVSAVIVLMTPLMLKSPAATALYVFALLLSLTAVSAPPGMEWFVPALFVKLLIGHAVAPSRS